VTLSVVMLAKAMRAPPGRVTMETRDRRAPQAIAGNGTVRNF